MRLGKHASAAPVITAAERLLNADAWPALVRQSVRYSGDQCQLTLCPQWLIRRLKEEALCGSQQALTAAAFIDSECTRVWHESYLSERMQDEIAEGQIIVETEGNGVSQVNALSVLDCTGHPLPFGELSRISCVWSICVTAKSTTWSARQNWAAIFTPKA